MNKEQINKIIKEKNLKIDTIFNFLGSRVGRGKELFKKIDYTYVLESAKFAESLKVPLFMHISAQGSNPNSCFYYMQIKGETERDLQKIILSNLVVLKPGLIMDREGERFGEKCAKWIPFISKVKSEDLSKYAHDLAINILEKKESKGYQTFNNSDIVNKN